MRMSTTHTLLECATDSAALCVNCACAPGGRSCPAHGIGRYTNTGIWMDHCGRCGVTMVTLVKERSVAKPFLTGGNGHCQLFDMVFASPLSNKHSRRESMGPAMHVKRSRFLLTALTLESCGGNDPKSESGHPGQPCGVISGCSLIPVPQKNAVWIRPYPAFQQI